MQKSQVLFVCVLCAVLACVLSRSLPDYRSQRVKRQYADMTISKHQANAGVSRLFPKACREFACGLVDIAARWKRAGSDQRIAELQALIAIANGDHRGEVGHGRVDPGSIGKRKRSEDYALERDELDELRRMALLQRVLDTLMEDPDS